MLIVIGSCIGSGIFITPSEIAAELSSPMMIMLLWGLGGLITLSGALSYSELSSRFPDAGGVYVYLREAYGNWTAFLFGWVVLTAVTSGAIAALAVAFSTFLTALIPQAAGYETYLAAAIIVVTSVTNLFGVNAGQWLSGFFTSLKLAGILFLVAAGLFLQGAATAGPDWSLPSIDSGLLHHFFLALTGVYWSYGGWQHATYISSEVVDPKKNLSKAMIAGSLTVMSVYLLCNYAYMNVLSVPEIADSGKPAAAMMEKLFAGTGGMIIATLVCISVFGTIAIYTMTAPRIYFAMANDKVFFPFLARIHPRFRTPVNAILIQSAWAIALLFFWGTFKKLISYVTFTEGIFLALAALAVIVLRKKKGAVRGTGYRTPLYPITPLFYFLISLVFLINGLAADLTQLLAAAIIFSAGSLVFLIFRQNRKSL